jgi:serine/threonine-protein kinase HipA
VPRVRELRVWLRGTLLGTLRAPRIGRVTCEYTDDAIDRYGSVGLLLSCSLPIRTGKRDAWPFVTGLLPEGHHRQAMATLAGVPTTDLLGMLDRFGRDVAGAVIVSADDPAEHLARDARAVPYTDTELESALSELGEHPLGLFDDSELSVAGIQDKMLLVRLDDGRWARPTHGYPSTHILKLDDRIHAGLVRAEHACLRLARAAGLDAAKSQLLAFGSAECIVVERFDRKRGDNKQPERIHQEDACQAVGVDPESAGRRGKYEAHGGPAFHQIANLLMKWSPEPKTELRRLLDRLVFTLAIGDADAHGKNVALLHPEPGVLRLAPLYDTVPTMVWPRLRTDAAMSVGGATRLPSIGVDDAVREATRWGLGESAARLHVRGVLDRMRQALADGPVDVDTPALESIAERLRRLAG